MMRLLHTLPVAALAAFGLAAPALAAGQGGSGVAAWIEMSRPADALAQGKIVVELDTKGMPKGENIIALNLFTNSALRPVISLQIAGTIQ